MSHRRYLTKSRFKQALECPDKLFYAGRKQEYADNRNEDEFLRELARGGVQVGELAKCYFSGGVEVETLDNEKALAETRRLMHAEHITIFEAAVEFEDCLVRVDVLEKRGNVVKLYEAKAKSFDSVAELFSKKTKELTAEWKPYVHDIAFQVYVVRSAFPQYTVSGSLFVVNKKSVCTVDGLFQKFLVRTIGGRFRVFTNPELAVGEPILSALDVNEAIENILQGQKKLAGTLLSFDDFVRKLSSAYRDQYKIGEPLSVACKKCEFTAGKAEKLAGLKSGYEECWRAKANFHDDDFQRPHVFDMWSLKAGPFIDSGKYLVKDLAKADFERDKTTSKRLIPPHERQWLQAERVHNPALGPYFDKSGIEHEISRLSYPLHFIDFETTRNAIPYIKGFRPYAQIAFQFSHHTLDEEGRLSHGEWIERRRGNNPNIDFLRALFNQLKNDNGSILIYSSYENTVLLEIYDALGASFEVDKDELMQFIRSITWSEKEGRGMWMGERKMVDMKNWVMDYYYSPLTNGSNSLKDILPAILNESRLVRERFPDYIRRDDNGLVANPYQLLPSIFDSLHPLPFEALSEGDKLSDGGAAMCAFNMMQYREMDPEEREQIIKALLRYCELDTLAMVMLFVGLSNFGNE